jgi:hypothetical protein
MKLISKNFSSYSDLCDFVNYNEIPKEHIQHIKFHIEYYCTLFFWALPGTIEYWNYKKTQ